jgi:hypothetical protein
MNDDKRENLSRSNYIKISGGLSRQYQNWQNIDINPASDHCDG